MKRVGIIGGGAAGMTAAIAAAGNGAQVTLFERTAKLGKKILSTGNGRCNLANDYLAENCFHGRHPEFALQVIRHFGLKETLDFFEHIGIHPIKNSEGYYYPRSMQAASVAKALIRELERLKVKVVDETGNLRVRPHGDSFQINCEKGSFAVDSLILACGGQAAPQTGSDGSGYALAAGLGLKVIPAVPALVPLTSPWKGFKELSGIRTAGRITLYAGERKIASEAGELQLCDYGLSGIPVFQISGFAARLLTENKKTVLEAEINFMEEFSNGEVKQYLYHQIRQRGAVRCGDFLTGLLPEKLGLQLFKRIGVSYDLPAGRLSDRQIGELIREMTAFRVPITGNLGFDRAQVCSGGVDTAQIDPTTMEVKRIPGLFVAGELLDIDGICGGYNLQFAWSSGYLAGRGAAQ
ncbi:MAG: aminoacetone oxidase family FAD-binding enzyme [Lachnospiraceae bacterium]|nr:aminoacetone oxidase family FAD-binding enzyme [Lachnospiraceae bacterium]